MALAQVDNATYLQFYAGRSKDQTLILDNGAYEGCFDFKMFESRINLLKPNIVILPDLYLGQWEMSLHLSLGYLHITKATMCEFMFIPQAQPGDLEGFMSALARGMKDPRITWIGIPRCLSTDITHNGLMRCFVADFIRKERPDLKLHAMGMVDGNPYELCYLAERGVNSCDSSAPVWRGLQGKDLHETWNGPDIDFDHVKELGKMMDKSEDNLWEVDRAIRYGNSLRERSRSEGEDGPSSPDHHAVPDFGRA